MESAVQFLARCLWIRDAAGVWSLNPDWRGRPEYVAALPEYEAYRARKERSDGR